MTTKYPDQEKYREKNKEKYRFWRKTYRNKHKNDSVWRQKQRDSQRAWKRKYPKKAREVQRIYNRKYAIKYPEKIKEYKRRYRLSHPEKSYRKKPYQKYRKSNCEKCGFIPIQFCQLEVDHIDGNHKNNSIENLQTLCANCHRLKSFLNGEFPYNRNLKRSLTKIHT
ncbi:MAG: HNH endonuclease [Patescibacteria group bacterium]